MVIYSRQKIRNVFPNDPNDMQHFGEEDPETQLETESGHRPDGEKEVELKSV